MYSVESIAREFYAGYWSATVAGFAVWRGATTQFGSLLREAVEAHQGAHTRLLQIVGEWGSVPADVLTIAETEAPWSERLVSQWPQQSWVESELSIAAMSRASLERIPDSADARWTFFQQGMATSFGRMASGFAQLVYLWGKRLAGSSQAFDMMWPAAFEVTSFGGELELPRQDLREGWRRQLADNPLSDPGFVEWLRAT